MKKLYRRTPRNFDGTKNTGHSIGPLLSDILLQMEQRVKGNVEEIATGWKSVIGEALAPMTDVASFEKGILTVKVKSSTLYSLLCQHEKNRLLSELQKKYSKEKIRDLKFRIG
jgi:hypothetical protein